MAGALLGMGNPLLDISATCTAETLTKYDLQPASAILAEEQHMPLFADLQAMPDVQYIAAGATQNSIRVTQWMLQEPKVTSYMGSVGKDENAKRLSECCEKEGVAAVYHEDDAVTGTCGVVIVDKERSLVANLSAANNYKVEHLKANWDLVEKAKVFYSAGFFMTVSPESIDLVAKHACEQDKTYCFNISAPFLVEVPPFKAVLTKTMPYVDFLFGNETEFAAFAKSEGWEETDLKEIAKKVAALPKEGKKPRHVIITQGADPTIIAVNGEVTEHPIVKIDKEQLVDTNGAGDAYVGGFLAGLVKGVPVEECARAGASAACYIVQQSGTSFPGSSDFRFSNN